MGEDKLNEKNYNKSNNFGLKLLCFLNTLIIVMLLVYITYNRNDGTSKSTNKTNIKTTTIEEVSDLKSAINNIYEAAVYIEVTEGRVGSSGSGFVYKVEGDSGYILTNYHVIEQGKKYNVVFSDGKEVEATLVNGDMYYDIAILKVDSKNVIKIAKIADSSIVELGDTVFTVGAPLGKEYMGTITKGIISGTNRMVEVALSGGNYMMDVIQTDASINSGNSGGPICNIKGEVLGITSSNLIGSGVEGMGFAIPINSVMEIIDDLESGKKIDRPYIGVQLADVANAFALQYYYGITVSDKVKYGAVLSYVEEGKTAFKSGLKEGDVIIEMDGKKVEDVSYFRYLLYKHSIGDKVRIKYYRGDKLNETTLVLSEAIPNK